MVEPEVALRRRLAALSPQLRTRLLEGLRDRRGTRHHRPAPPAGDTLTPLRPEGARSPLFLAHPSAGSTVPYLPLAQRLDADRPVIGIDAVGLAREPPLTTVSEMTERYLRAIRGRQPHGPYHLAGWSMGGIVAYALATSLRAAGAEVATLVLLDSMPPRPEDPVDDVAVLALFAANFSQMAGVGMAPVTADELRAQPPHARARLVLRRIIDSGAASAATEEFLAARMRIFQALLAAGAHWRPERYDGRVDLVCSEASAGDGQAEAWSSIASGPVVTHLSPGDHFSMMRPPHVTVVARTLRELLEHAD